jgi:hypothetical protein
MAREITVNGRKKLSTLQKEFSDAFNYLFIAFLDIADRNKTGELNQIDLSKSISEVRSRFSNEELSLNGRTLIKNIEKYFEKELGIYCQIGVHNYNGKTLFIPTDDAFNNMGLTAANKWAHENNCAAIGKQVKLSDIVFMGDGQTSETTTKQEKPKEKTKEKSEDLKAKEDEVKKLNNEKALVDNKENSKDKSIIADIKNTPNTDLVNSFRKIPILNTEILLLENIFNLLIDINGEMTYYKNICDDNVNYAFLLSDYSLELVTKIGNYSGLGNKLSKYKELLQKLSKIDEDAAKIKFNDIDSKLDSYDSDFRYWLHKVESNRKDKRKTSDSLKKFQKNVNRFTNIFHEFSYSGWLP